jgi:hypothetical protein
MYDFFFPSEEPKPQQKPQPQPQTAPKNDVNLLDW